MKLQGLSNINENYIKNSGYIHIFSATRYTLWIYSRNTQRRVLIYLMCFCRVQFPSFATTMSNRRPCVCSFFYTVCFLICSALVSMFRYKLFAHFALPLPRRMHSRNRRRTFPYVIVHRFRSESGKRVDFHRMINCIDTECLSHYFSQLHIRRIYWRVWREWLCSTRIGEDKIFGQIEKSISEGCKTYNVDVNTVINNAFNLISAIFLWNVILFHFINKQMSVWKHWKFRDS